MNIESVEDGKESGNITFYKEGCISCGVVSNNFRSIEFVLI